MSSTPSRLAHADLLQLKRWNTPTIFNGWEQFTKHDASREGFNVEDTRDFMPEMGPMVGYAVTVVVEPSKREHPEANPRAWSEYREYVASVLAPKIVIVQDLDKPRLHGAFWGEVNSNIHRALGCVGTIIDGGIRDLDEMRNSGFKAIARRMCVGHAFSCPVRWGAAVEVFGRTVQPGQLVHADKHGFLAIPPEDEARLLDAARFMDANECETLIPAARDTAGKSTREVLDAINAAGQRFGENAKAKFGRKGEW
ncbi:MAG: RraA family protein [Chthoniobacteraceae bacterium]